jgi:hydroxyacyl-ACP dehydratase HTD2-like protein with hotdog domain
MNAEPGTFLPELVKHPTRRQLVQYAGASGDFYEIHYDQDYARSVGLPGVILHGLLQAGFLAQLVTDWMGPTARLKTFEVSYRRTALPDQPYRCRGMVKSREGTTVEVEIWGEDSDGNRLMLGSATVEV